MPDYQPTTREGRALRSFMDDLDDRINWSESTMLLAARPFIRKKLHQAIALVDADPSRLAGVRLMVARAAVQLDLTAADYAQARDTLERAA
ncbi:MAG: hypothetical protein AMXMBFR23_03440 [Chloroflexota bacterium]